MLGYLKYWIRDCGWSLRARFLGLPVFQVDTLLIPWKSILTSPPVWGIVAANFALDWAFYILLISMPIFLLDVMKTSITKVNMLSHIAGYVYNSISYTCITEGVIAWEKQPTFCDSTCGFPAKREQRNGPKNSILMTSHYPDLGGASDWSKQISHATRPIVNITRICVSQSTIS